MVNSPSFLLRIFDFCSTRSLMAALELAVAATSSSSSAGPGAWKTKQNPLQTNRNGRFMSNSSNLNRKKQKTQPRTTAFPQCATSSVAAGVDAVVMIAALFACAYLFLPYLQLLYRAIELTFSALVQSANDECALLVFNVFGISLAVLVIGVLLVIIVRYAMGGKKCSRPNCLGLKDSPKFDFQIETEEMVKKSTVAPFSEPCTSSKEDVLIELSGDHQREIDDFNDPNFSTVTIQRDLFYGYDTLLENVSDPSHINFAHHKVTGRRDRAKPLPFKMTSSGKEGFSAIDDGNPRIISEFIAPCYNTNRIEIDAKLPLFGDQKWIIWICSFNIPMAPGKTRSIVCSARNFFQFTVPGQAWWQVVPRWYEHFTSNLVYDGDMIVLQGQEKVFHSKSMEEDFIDVNQQYTKITFTPTQSDRLVLAFRNWFRKHGNSQPYWFGTTNQQPLPSTVLSKRQMLDRYEQHTLICSSCKAAYTSFQTWEKILIGVTVLLCVSVGLPSEIRFRLLLSAAAVFSASMAYLTHEFQKKFVFVDYIHSEID